MARLLPAHVLRGPTRDPELVGLAGEALAARVLRRRGWRLLARRLETGRAEVDLLFLDGGELVCVEVKAGRAGARFRPGERADARRVRRLRAAARDLARRYRRPARVEVAEVVRGPVPRVALVPGATIRA